MCAIITIQINISWGSKVFYQKECKTYLWEIQIGELHDLGEFLKFEGDVRPEIRMCSQQGQAGSGPACAYELCASSYCLWRGLSNTLGRLCSRPPTDAFCYRICCFGSCAVFYFLILPPYTHFFDSPLWWNFDYLGTVHPSTCLYCSMQPLRVSL